MRFLSRRWLMRWAILVVLIGLYALGGFVFAPRFLRSELIDQIDRNLGVRASVGQVRFNPFLFQVEIRDFTLPDPAGGKIAGFQRLFVDFELSSIWHRAYVFKDIELNAPVLHPAVSAAGTLNLLALKPRVPPPAAPPKPPGAETPLPRIDIGRFRITAGDVTYEDLSRRTPFSAKLEPINIELQDFTTGVDGGRFTFAASSTLGERLQWRGHIVLQPLASDGDFQVDNLQARTVWSYLKDRLAFVVSSGSIGLHGHYDFALKEQPQLQVALDTVTLSNFGVRPDAASADWITLPQLRVAGTAFDLQRRQVAIDRIELTAPRVGVWMEPGGRINLLRLAGAPSPAAAAVPAPLPAGQSAQSAVPPWQLSLHELQLSGATLAAEDRSASPTAALTLAPLNLTVTGASLDLGKPVTLAFDTGLNGSGRLGIAGTVTPAPLAADLKIDASALALTSIQPYLKRATSVTLLDGTLSSALQLRMHPGRNRQASVTASGSVTVDHLHTIDNELRKELVSWERLNISGIQFQQNPDRIVIDAINVVKPFARVIIGPDRTVNVAEALHPPGWHAAPLTGAPPPTASKVVRVPAPPAQGPAGGKPAAAAPVTPMQIRKITIRAGQAQFADLSITPNFATGIVALNGTVAGLSSNPQSRARIDLKGQVDQYSPVSITGEANVLSARKYLDLAMSFRNMELTTFNPYSGKFAGYNITKGKLTTELQYKIDDRKLDARHHIVIDQLEFGDKTASKDAVSLPIKLAVALLKDRNGVIDLDVPVSGSLDDPQFRLGPIIWKVVLNLLVKIVTSPFALLGDLFGGGPDLQFVDFAPGSAVLDAAGQQKVTAVGKALAERPQLKVEVPIAATPAADRPALIEKAFNDELLAAASLHAAKGAAVPALDSLDVPARIGLMTQVYRKVFGKPPEFPKAPAAAQGAPAADPNAAKLELLSSALHERITVSDEALKALAQSRAQLVQQGLLAGGQVDPARVFLVVNDKVTIHDKSVRLELSLQ